MEVAARVLVVGVDGEDDSGGWEVEVRVVGGGCWWWRCCCTALLVSEEAYLRYV